MDNHISNYVDVGIFFSSSNKNTIPGNQVSNNGKGVILPGFDDDNWVHHNDFVNNTKQTSEFTGTSHWDNGHPSGGNYWSDHTGNVERLQALGFFPATGNHDFMYEWDRMPSVWRIGFTTH